MSLDLDDLLADYFAAENRGDVVTARVSGNFPNSPANLDHVFEIHGDRIASLEIG